VIPSIRKPTKVHVTKGERLHERDGLIVEHLDFGFGHIKSEDEVGGLGKGRVWDGLEKIDRQWDP